MKKVFVWSLAFLLALGGALSVYHIVNRRIRLRRIDRISREIDSVVARGKSAMSDIDEEMDRQRNLAERVISCADRIESDYHYCSDAGMCEHVKAVNNYLGEQVVLPNGSKQVIIKGDLHDAIREKLNKNLEILHDRKIAIAREQVSTLGRLEDEMESIVRGGKNER